MKTTIDMKELKNLVKKIEKSVLTKGYNSIILSSVLIYTEYDRLHMMATDLNNELDINTNQCNIIENGKFCIDIDDLKRIGKLKCDQITIHTEENQIFFVTDKGKSIIIENVFNTEDFPVIEITGMVTAFKMVCNEFYSILKTLEPYLHDSKNTNKAFCCYYNIDMKNHRINACDSHRIGSKLVACSHYNPDITKEINIHRDSFYKLENALKSENSALVTVSITDQKYYVIKSENFRMITKVPDISYFDIMGLLKNCESCGHIEVDRSQLLEIATYNNDLSKSKSTRDIIPTIFYINDTDVYTYMQVGKITSFDRMKNAKVDYPCNLLIAFNNRFLIDLCNSVKSDRITLQFANSKSPAITEDNDYTFVVLPINLGNPDIKESNIINLIEKTA